MTDNNPHLEIRPLKETDYEAFLAQLNPWGMNVHGRAYLDWIASSRPGDNLSMVAVLNNQPIGYYGTITVPIQIGNQIVYAYRGGMFVHPDHRSQLYNVFDQLVRKMHERMKEKHGVMYIFPISRSVKYHIRRIHCRPVKTIPRYLLILRSEFVVGHRLGLVLDFFWKRWLSHIERTPGTFTLRELQVFDERFNLLWETARRRYPILSVRNAEFLSWRYRQEPGHSYIVFAAEEAGRLRGYIILSSAVKQGKGRIVDLFDDGNSEITKALLGKAVAHFLAHGANRIEFYISNSAYEKSLRRLGFLRRPVRKAELMLAKSYSPLVEDSVWQNPKNWFLTTADMLLA
jgi:hypothetical protein